MGRDAFTIDIVTGPPWAGVPQRGAICKGSDGVEGEIGEGGEESFFPPKFLSRCFLRFFLRIESRVREK